MFKALQIIYIYISVVHSPAFKYTRPSDDTTLYKLNQIFCIYSYYYCYCFQTGELNERCTRTDWYLTELKVKIQIVKNNTKITIYKFYEILLKIYYSEIIKFMPSMANHKSADTANDMEITEKGLKQRMLLGNDPKASWKSMRYRRYVDIM